MLPQTTTTQLSPSIYLYVYQRKGRNQVLYKLLRKYQWNFMFKTYRFSRQLHYTPSITHDYNYDYIKINQITYGNTYMYVHWYILTFTLTYMLTHTVVI